MNKKCFLALPSLFLLVIMLVSCTSTQPTQSVYEDDAIGEQTMNKQTLAQDKTVSYATVAGGCFWCMEPPFENAPGVLRVDPGYSGGSVDNPTYSQVSSGDTGHYEVVEITFDPAIITYEQLLDIFWRNIDPTDNGGQFNDRGQQYATAIFYHNKEQQKIAEESKKEIAKHFEKEIATKILPYKEFFIAEEYHQDYHKKNPIRYSVYRSLSGRDSFLKETWGSSPHGKEAYQLLEDSSARPFVKPSDEVLKEQLTPIQYRVTQQGGTEPAHDNKYWNNTRAGIYVDVVSGEALFSSTHKYDSKTGWPSFTQPISDESVVTKKDFKIIIPRTEVLSRQANSHLGHVFSDGPQPTGLRYCMNSAALRFVPYEELQAQGYEEYLHLFDVE